MKKNIAVFVFIVILFGLSGFSQNEVKEDQDEFDKIIEKVLKPTMDKVKLLAVQKATKQSILIVCQTFTLRFAYDEILNENAPTHNDLKELFISKLLKDYTKTGKALNTIYDKYLMKEVEQYVEYSEAVPNFGMKLVTEHELADAYIVPEKSKNRTDTGQSLEDGMGSNNVEKNTLLSRYGDEYGADFEIFEKYLEDNNLSAIEDMTNFYQKFNRENLEEYQQYLDAILEIADKFLNSDKDNTGILDSDLDDMDLDLLGTGTLDELKKKYPDVDWGSYKNK